MSALDNVKNRHVSLLETISDLRAMLKPEILSIRPNAKLAYETICSLSDNMKDHLAKEDASLYPSLLTHENPQVKSIAWGFINGEKPLRKMFDDYHRKWLKNCDFNFTEEFLVDTHEVLELLESRIDRERTVLIPKLEQIGVFPSRAQA